MLRSVLACAALLLVLNPADGQTPTRSVDDAVAVQPGDLIRVKVWRDENLSGEFVLEYDGLVTLALWVQYCQ